MALVNYSLPFAAPAPPPPFLGGLPGYNTAPAVNSLFYGHNPPPAAVSAANALPQHLGGRQTYHLPPPAPSRKAATAPRRPNNDPYRNQTPPQYKPAVRQQQPPPQQRQQQPPQQQRHQQQQQQQQQPQHQQKQKQQQPPQAQKRQQQEQDYYYDDDDGYSPKQNPAPPPVAKKQAAAGYPSNPPGYTRIQENPSPAAKTTLHAVLDYDDDFDDYSYDDEDVSELPPEYRHVPLPAVTPIQGPIFVRNNSVPVVPLFSHPVLNNGSLVQIPILWTALSVALGLEIRGEIIRGVPCIKRFHQLFCPTAGNSYPIDRIDRFIDDNKALMKRMYGEFQMSTEYGPPSREAYGDQNKRNVKRDVGEDGKSGKSPPREPFHPAGAPDPAAEGGDSYFSKLRQTRQSFRNNQSSESGRVDACESKVEITTPYWASNSAGKIRAIVNTQHFEQAIHQEVCSSKMQTKRCSGDCGCEQKYKWHRLLAYDPDNDCKGIFMDWFLFPSCCVCRCAPLFGNQ